MPSPFPGMDPFIESRRIWPDFHNRLADEISTRLNGQISPRYYAALEPYVTYEIIEIAQSRARAIRPDVAIWRTPEQATFGGATLVAPVLDIAEATAVESAVTVEAPLELLSVEIHEADTDLLVTAIEILSPVNKQRGHEAYADYQRKRRDLLRSGAHLIEIDLLRGGERPRLEVPVPSAAYYVMLSRVEDRPAVTVWPIQLKDRLPTIPVPLTAPDPDAKLILREVVASVYERGAYSARIDYAQPIPAPELSADDQAFVASLLKPAAVT